MTAAVIAMTVLHGSQELRIEVRPVIVVAILTIGAGLWEGTASDRAR